MPATAMSDFREDLDRARSIVDHASTLPQATDAEQMLRSDILRSGWMFAVGAMDAYFCDAYTDLVAALLIAKSNQSHVALPSWVMQIRLSVSAILEPYTNRANWRWRMAARKMMANEDILKLSKVQTYFNPFFRRGHKFFNDLIGGWMGHADATCRFFTVTGASYRALGPRPKRVQQRESGERMAQRLQDAIIQRRHDCIHNCDRPAVRPQQMDRPGTVRNVIRDVEFFICRCDEHIEIEFPVFLTTCGFSETTKTNVGYR